MKEKFRSAKLSKANMIRVNQINTIIREYEKQGYRLTLRQLYYQLVSRDVIPNQPQEYKKLSVILREGRMAGIIDWDAIVDRLRSADKPPAWDSPADIVKACAKQFQRHRMEGQENYLEVWVEKDALSEVLSRVTYRYHVPIQVNRGYSSVSALYESYKRFKEAIENGQKVIILYLGDFDPSGVDMIRDVYDRPLEMLLEQADDGDWVPYDPDTEYEDLMSTYFDDERCYSIDEEDPKRMYFSPYKAKVLEMFKVIPIALTREQIRRYNPPPNPAKVQDPRAAEFIRQHGGQSWEVDALRPETLDGILTDAIESRLDLDKYEEILEQEKVDRKQLAEVAENL